MTSGYSLGLGLGFRVHMGDVQSYYLILTISEPPSRIEDVLRDLVSEFTLGEIA